MKDDPLYEGLNRPPTFDPKNDIVDSDGKVIGNVLFMNQQKTDADLARDLREEIAPHLVEVCKILDKARRLGLMLNFPLQPDAFGRHIPPYVTVTKSI